MLTTKQAGAQLSLAPRSVNWLIKRGLLAATKHGRDWKIDQAEVDRYASERRAAHRPKQERE